MRWRSLDSSAKTTDDSMPAKPATTVASAAPTPGTNSAPGLKPSKLMPFRAPPNRSPRSNSRTTAISLTSRTDRIRPLMSTRSSPSRPVSAQATSAMTHQGGEPPNQSRSSGSAADPMMPYRPSCSAL